MLHHHRQLKQPTNPLGTGRRNGFVYFVVISTTAILSIIALCAIMVARLELRSAAGGSDWQEARQLALAGIESGILEISDNADWRTDLTNDTEYPSVAGIALGNGTFSWKLKDEDGVLDDQLNDAVRVYGIGRVRETVYVESVLLKPTGAPLACLEMPLHANGDFDLDFGIISSSGTISTNADANAANGVMVGANVAATGSVTGSTWYGATISGVTPRDVPDRHSVFEFYLGEGTHIDVNTLTVAGNDRILERCLLSPGSNPFGDNTTNAQGIYVIDCLGNHLKIRDSRIVGTLVILNPGPQSLIEGSISWEPAISYYPSLLVDGDMEISFGRTALSETAASVNYNPAASPWPYFDGAGDNMDTDAVDDYPSRLVGLVYVSGILEVASGAPAFDGCVVTGADFDLEDAAPTFRYRGTFLNFPPPGFTTGDVMAVSPGSWRRDPAQ